MAPANWNLAAAGELRESIREAFQAGRVHLIVDLSTTDDLGAIGLGILVGSLRRANARGGSVRLAGGNDRIRSMLRVSGLHALLPMFPDVSAAVRATSRGLCG